MSALVFHPPTVKLLKRFPVTHQAQARLFFAQNVPLGNRFSFGLVFNQPCERFAAGLQILSIRGLAIHEPLSGNHRHKRNHALAVCAFAGIPAKFKLAGVF